MKLYTIMSMLFITLPNVAFAKSEGRDQRRELGEMMDLPGSCFEMSDAFCKDFSTNSMPATSTFDAKVAFDLADYYCCALRKDNPMELYKVASNFRNFCTSKPYLKWQNSLNSHEGLTLAERTIAYYCPNYISPKEFFNPSWASLWSVARLGLQSSAFMTCNNGPSKSNGRVTVTINGLQEDRWPHVWISDEEGWTISWSTAHSSRDSSSFDTVTGVEGQFEEGQASTLSIPVDAPTWTVEGINMEKMMDERKRISSEPYGLLQNNCAHVALKLLSAGLGCEATIVPFFSPASMINVMNNIASKCNV